MNAVSNPADRLRRWPIIASYLAVSGMIISFADILIHFQAWLFPKVDTGNLLIVCALVTFEAFFSYWLYRRLPTAQKQVGLYRATEMAILLVILKFFVELRLGPSSFWNNFLLWSVQFPINIVNSRYLLTVIPVLIAWYIGYLFATDLYLLGSDDPTQLDDRSKVTPLRLLILKRFLNVGMFVIVLAAIPPQEIIPTTLPAPSNAVPAVLAYFVFGVMLLSLTRYTSLESTWRQSRLQIPVQIPRRWFAYSALILVVLVLLVSWLPTNFEFGLLATVNAIFHIIYLAVLTVYGLIMLVFGSLTRLFMSNPPGDTGLVPSTTPPPQNIPVAAGSIINWQLVESIFLWGSLIVLVIIALRQYISLTRISPMSCVVFVPCAGSWSFGSAL